MSLVKLIFRGHANKPLISYEHLNINLAYDLILAYFQLKIETANKWF
jgi:hypothetical protein